MSDTHEQINFATIGEVFDDGVSLLFDGDETASEKHYRCNTSILFRAGDRVKILEDSGTYVVEYVVGSPKKPEPYTGLPAGGKANQSLLKSSSEDYATKWGQPPGTMPTGGSIGQILKKTDTGDYNADWGNIDGILPPGGSTGQVLQKSGSGDYETAWKDIQGTVPTGGSNWPSLEKKNTNAFPEALANAKRVANGGACG